MLGASKRYRALSQHITVSLMWDGRSFRAVCALEVMVDGEFNMDSKAQDSHRKFNADGLTCVLQVLVFL